MRNHTAKYSGTPATLAVWSLRQKNYKLYMNLGYTASVVQKERGKVFKMYLLHLNILSTTW